MPTSPATVPATTRAAVATAYGSPEVVRIQAVPTPQPGPDEVLVRVHATTVTSGDWRVRSLTVPPGFGLAVRLMFGLRKLRQPILGSELAGTVAAVGANVTRFQVGDAVVAYSDSKLGAHAEYVAVAADGAIAPKPTVLSWEEAAALSFGGTTALHFFRLGDLQPGERLLVNGASGSVGTAAVQIAKHRGAYVTGVCSTRNADLVRSLGADAVIDYTERDFTDGGERYDLVMDTAGTAPFARSRLVLNEGGRLLQVLGGLSDMLRAPLIGWTTNQRLIAGNAAGTADYQRELVALAEAGAYRPVIDRVVPFEDIVEAHRHVDRGRKRGSVVVTVTAES
ncbi:MAG: NAD(P)-dependent alcohol dehydrogenase [Bacteroidota bacterium]